MWYWLLSFSKANTVFLNCQYLFNLSFYAETHYKPWCVFHSNVIILCWHLAVTFVIWARMDLHALLIDLMLCVFVHVSGCVYWTEWQKWKIIPHVHIVGLYFKVMAAFWILYSREFNERCRLLVWLLKLHFNFWHLVCTCVVQCTIDTPHSFHKIFIHLTLCFICFYSGRVSSYIRNLVCTSKVTTLCYVLSFQQMRTTNSPVFFPSSLIVEFLHSTSKHRGKSHKRKAVISRSTTQLLNAGGRVQFFTTIRRLGNKFGNVSSLRAWAPNEARPGCSRLALRAACSPTHISKSVGQ